MTNTSNNVTKHCVMLMLLALSLTGCGTPLPPTNVERAKTNPPNAELMKQPRSLKSSERVRSDIKKWDETLNSTQSK